MLRNKRGEEFVETAMVLPVLILTILSMILLILYFYLCLSTQTEVHRDLITEAAESGAAFRIIEKGAGASSEVGGILDMIMEKRIEGRMYVLNHGRILRAGEFIGLD